MTIHLLDANVLIAATTAEHEHHEHANAWLAETEQFAICPVVEGALIRFVLRVGERSSTAWKLVAGVREAARCTFWADDISYAAVDAHGIQGHRQVTDEYLVALARHHGARLATFDRALAQRHPDGCTLLGQATLGE